MTADVESPPSAKRSSAEVPWESVPCLHGNPASNLRASLKGMATMCRENATAHGKAAKKHVLRNNILQVTSILITSSATIYNGCRFNIRLVMGGTTHCCDSKRLIERNTSNHSSFKSRWSQGKASRIRASIHMLSERHCRQTRIR